MRNLDRKSFDGRFSHHGCKYCSDADKHRRHNLQYLRDFKEINLEIKKDRAYNSDKVIGLF